MLLRTTSLAVISHRLNQNFPQGFLRFCSYLQKMNPPGNAVARNSPQISSDTVNFQGRNFAVIVGSGSRHSASMSSSKSTYEEEFPVLSASAISHSKNRQSNKMRIQVDPSTKESMGENSPLCHERSPTSSSTPKQYDTSFPPRFEKQSSPPYSKELQSDQRLVDDEVSDTNSEHDCSNLPPCFGKKHMSPHSRQQGCQGSTQKYEPDYSSLPAQFGKKSMPSHSRRPQLGQPYHQRDVVIGNSDCSRDLKKYEPFDICKSDGRNPVRLSPSLNISNMDGQNEIGNSMEATIQKVLRPGMVLLKGYISLTDQIDIVKKCRELGVGPGGFYQPGYQDGAKLRLQMMCLGMNWDPQTRKYENRHPLDGSEPPSIPKEFSSLVERAIQDSHSLIKRNNLVNNVEDILPRMSPNICIVNFYRTSGRLGLHQDRDESKESLIKGLPVISFSLGDSAEFLYGDQRNIDAAERVVLESGDVLIFGGKSRHIFHGVSSIIPNSAPNNLLEETNLLPGRLNLTFRQF